MRHGLINIALIGLLTLLPSQLFASKVHPPIIQFKKSMPNKKELEDRNLVYNG